MGKQEVELVRETRMSFDFKRVIIASNNNHKIQEIKGIIGEFFDEILSLRDAGIKVEVEENGKTFEENAFIKAKAIFDLTGDAVLADDSGLEVFALNGEPGVYSARYSGEHGDDIKNNQKLLKELEGVNDRRARFVCSMVLLTPEGKRINATGYIEGIIGYEEKGNNGFGYDPLFIIPDMGKTFAELEPNEKNSISHRSRALENLKTSILNA